MLQLLSQHWSITCASLSTVSAQPEHAVQPAADLAAALHVVQGQHQGILQVHSQQVSLGQVRTFCESLWLICPQIQGLGQMVIDPA